jgi:hypothetical protein
MATKLVSALVTFSRSLAEARSLATDAQIWSTPPSPGAKAQITPKRRDMLTEMAFLRAFTAWEMFLEETFLLYLVGYKAPRAARPKRCGFPADLVAASEWCNDGKDYVTWDAPNVRKRADRWLDQGTPFTPALRVQQNRFEQLATLRNAIAHESPFSKRKFQNLVRLELPTVPAAMSVGAFLVSLVPNITPPTSYLDHYFDHLERAAKTIVPK